MQSVSGLVFCGTKDRVNGDTDVRLVSETEGWEIPLPLCLEVMNHSPTGFEWGYSGSGPTQLATAIVSASLLAGAHVGCMDGEPEGSFLSPKRWAYGAPWGEPAPRAKLMHEEVRALQMGMSVLNPLVFGFRSSVSAFTEDKWRIPMDAVTDWMKGAIPNLRPNEHGAWVVAKLLQYPPKLEAPGSDYIRITDLDF